MTGNRKTKAKGRAARLRGQGRTAKALQASLAHVAAMTQNHVALR